MMQIVPRWKVIITRNGYEDMVFWVTDRFLSNVMQHVAKMSFVDGGNVEPLSIQIFADPETPR